MLAHSNFTIFFDNLLFENYYGLNIFQNDSNFVKMFLILASDMYDFR